MLVHARACTDVHQRAKLFFDKTGFSSDSGTVLQKIAKGAKMNRDAARSGPRWIGTWRQRALPRNSMRHSSYFHDRAESRADAITSHMFLAENLDCTDLRAIACKSAQLQALIYFDRTEF